MAITVTPLHPHIGAELRGVDLTRPVPPDDLAAIDAAFLRHAVLVFPEQTLSDEQQIAFSQHFGPLESRPDYAGSKKARLARREISDISNLDAEGQVMSADDKRLMFNRGNSSGTPTARSNSCRRAARCCRRARSRRRAARPSSPICAPPMT